MAGKLVVHDRGITLRDSRQLTHAVAVTTAVLTAAIAAGCGQDKPTSSSSPTAGPLQADVVPPPSENALKIAVSSAVLGADGDITLVLAGTYTGPRTTQWDQTSVDASAQGQSCTTNPNPGFAAGAAKPGSTVSGTWTVHCPPGQVEIIVDPFGGLLDSDTTTRITLH